MTIIPLGRDYNDDGINDQAIVYGNDVEIVAGSRKMDPESGGTLFTGTLDQLKANQDFPGAAAIIEDAQQIENALFKPAFNPVPDQAPKQNPASGSGKDFYHLKHRD